MKTIIPWMNRTERRLFIRYGRKAGDAATAVRFHIVAELSRGLLTKSEIARKLTVAPSTVTSVEKRFLRLGVFGLFDQRCQNGSAKVDAAFRRELQKVLKQTPRDHGWSRSTWTRELLCKEMERRGFIKVSVCTMGRALRSLGARLGRPKPVVMCPWPTKKREKRLKELRDLAARASAKEPVYYSDEVDIDLNPKIGRDWMLPGNQRRVVTPGQNQKHYLAGALNAKTRRLEWAEGTSKNSSLFCKLLWKLAAKHRRARRIHIILDNYGIHKSKATQRVLSSLGDKVVLHFLPPYCPDENPIERVWLDLHSVVTRNHKFKTMLELGGAVIDFLNSYDARRTINPALESRRVAA